MEKDGWQGTEKRPAVCASALVFGHIHSLVVLNSARLRPSGLLIKQTPVYATVSASVPAEFTGRRWLGRRGPARDRERFQEKGQGGKRERSWCFFCRTTELGDIALWELVVSVGIFSINKDRSGARAQDFD